MLCINYMQWSILYSFLIDTSFVVAVISSRIDSRSLSKTKQWGCRYIEKWQPQLTHSKSRSYKNMNTAAFGNLQEQYRTMLYILIDIIYRILYYIPVYVQQYLIFRKESVSNGIMFYTIFPYFTSYVECLKY